MKKDRKELILYKIPTNFVDTGTVFGGMIKLRNMIEAILLTGVVGWGLLQIPMQLYTKIIVLCLVLIPIFIFGVIGSNHESLSQFLYHFLQFHVKKEKLGAPTQKDRKKREKRKKDAPGSLSVPLSLEKISGVKKYIDRKNLQNQLEREKDLLPMPLTMTGEQIPISKIQNGMIYTKDGRYIKFLEILPSNFRNPKEQTDIIYSFASYLKICPVKLQMKVISKQADTNVYKSQLREEMQQETDHYCKELQQDYIKLLEEMSQQDSISRRFFLILEYRPYGLPKNNEKEAIYYLHTAANTAKHYLRKCGNMVLEYKNDNDFQIETLYMLLNRNTHSDIPFRSHWKKVMGAYLPYLGTEKLHQIPVTELITCQEADFTHPNYVVWDGYYYAFFSIPSNGYQTDVPAGWLSFLINAGTGIDLDLFIEKVDRRSIQTKVSQRLRINHSRLKGTSSTNMDFDTIESAIQAGYLIKQGLANNQDFFYLNILITVCADTSENLSWKCQELERMALSKDIQIQDCKYKEKQAFFSALPLASLDKDIYSQSKRNVLTMGVASCYPYLSYEMTDRDGILVGQNRSNHSIVMLDNFNTQLYKNANIALFGASGAGKTYTMQLMATRMRRKNIQVFILAPLKGHEFRRACHNIGGEFIQYTLGGNQCVNIMEIREKRTDIDVILDGMKEQVSYLASKIQQLLIFFQLWLPNMTIEEEQFLERGLIKTYETKGITFDNDSLWNESGKSYREMPILQDVYDCLIAQEETKRIAQNMYQLVYGSAATMFNGQTNVDLNNKYIVADISKLNGKFLPLSMFVLLDYIRDKIEEDRTKEKAVFVDELWHLIGADANSLAALFILEFFKTIRGYGGAAICSTQDSNDFFALEDGKYGKGIINACSTKMVLALEEEEAERMQNILNLSGQEVNQVMHFKPGEALICKNGDNVAVSIRASKKENELITTDRKELQRIFQEKKEAFHETSS